MPTRGQRQDQSKGGRKPGSFSPDDDETAQNEDNQRQAQEQEAGRKDDALDIEDEDADGEVDDEEDRMGGAQ
jgi:hypothetical protein